MELAGLIEGVMAVEDFEQEREERATVEERRPPGRRCSPGAA